MTDRTSTKRGGRRPRLSEFVDLGRSSVQSHYRAHLAKENVSPSARIFIQLKSFLNIEFVLRALKFAKVFFSFRCKFQDYNYAQGETGIFPLAQDPTADVPDDTGEIRLSLAADWGTGTQEAESVAENMLAFKPHYTVHLGDVYYVGDNAEVNEHCLKTDVAGNNFTPVDWPHGSVGSFALNGNHEMYANGNGYFGLFLPTLGIGPSKRQILKHQSASFFSLKNSHWMIIGLDTGYNSVGWASLFSLCKLEDPLMNWLHDRVEPQKFTGAIILLGHHQYYSAFERGYERPAEQIASKIFKDRTVLWFWGHEHRMAIYGKHRTPDGIPAFGRCIGHGGMPVSLGAPDGESNVPLVLYDNRVYADLEGTSVGFNGYANLTLAGPKLTVEYFSLAGSPPNGKTLLAREIWESRNGEPTGTGIEKTKDGLTQVAADINVARR